LAEQVSEGFGQAKAAIHEIRNPFGFAGEGSTRKRSEHELPEESQPLDNAYVVIERYKKHADAFNKLMSLRYRYELYFGRDAATVFGDLNQVLNEVLLASRKLSRHWVRQGRVHMEPEEFQQHLAEMHAAEAIFWEGSEDPDPVNPRVEAILASVDRTCRSVISPRYNLCTLAGRWLSWGRDFMACKD
jgi:hypothetical protein